MQAHRSDTLDTLTVNDGQLSGWPHGPPAPGTGRRAHGACDRVCRHVVSGRNNHSPGYAAAGFSGALTENHKTIPTIQDDPGRTLR